MVVEAKNGGACVAPTGKLEQLAEPAYKRLRYLFASAVALQMTVLGTMSCSGALVVATGTHVNLHVQPVDPNDLFRGDYLNLRYDISEVHTGGTHIANGQKVYVVLKKGLPYATAERVELSKPAVDGEHVAIRGSCLYEASGLANVVYGLERAYIPEKTGGRYNAAKGFTAEVAIDGSGNAVLCGVEP